jgi:hypothetical protein
MGYLNHLCVAELACPLTPFLRRGVRVEVPGQDEYRYGGERPSGPLDWRVPVRPPHTEVAAVDERAGPCLLAEREEGSGGECGPSGGELMHSTDGQLGSTEVGVLDQRTVVLPSSRRFGDLNGSDTLP